MFYYKIVYCYIEYRGCDNIPIKLFCITSKILKKYSDTTLLKFR